MVCCSGSSAVGSPLIEMGTSPTPNACSIVNCPAPKRSGYAVARLEPEGGGVGGVLAAADDHERTRQHRVGRGDGVVRGSADVDT